MRLDAINYINNQILTKASNLKYTVNSIAPSTFKDLYNSSSLVIWNGESEATIFQDATVNWAFRALHDTLHLKTGLGFTVDQEIELGRIQANHYTGLLSDLVYAEVAGQAEYYKINGIFVKDQHEYSERYLKALGWNL